MKQQKKETISRKKIANEILQQIGGSVIFVLLFIEIIAICMVGWLIITSKEKELTQESNAAANQITGFITEEGVISPQMVDICWTKVQEKLL